MSYSKVLLGLIISFVTGVGCKLLHIPVPSPPVLTGALLVFTMSLGYWLVDRYCAANAAKNKSLCAGHAIEKERK
ncbi:DUF1427 family protein [Undibacterium terreum]|uniref:XapX domain-containing protein n=1 Tax=Undibacterium terreum TaxID=1224302 RepID=A0A916UXJ7_9BURK|nr:DUF1427 family protein [Undibacterium terreum]GGC93263.1 hypothetical protein GCM10011396_45690 [Undibacterium terreum]